MSIIFSLHAQTDTISSDFLSKQFQKEFNKYQDPPKQYVQGNQFIRFQKEINFDLGFHAPFQNRSNLEATICSLQGAYYFSNNVFGVRSGVSYSGGFTGTKYFVGIPLMGCFRTKLGTISYPANNSFGDFFMNTFLNFFPKNIEIGLGPNLGIIGKDIQDKESIFVDNSFALSIDASLRFMYRIWRIGFGFNFAVSYLTTKNFKYYSIENHQTLSQPTLFGKGTFGATFIF